MKNCLYCAALAFSIFLVGCGPGKITQPDAEFIGMPPKADPNANTDGTEGLKSPPVPELPPM